MRAKQLKARDGGPYRTLLLDPKLDHSGVTPLVLDLLTTLAARLPFDDAARIATKFNLPVSSSQLERLIAPLASSCREGTFERLRAIPTPPTPTVAPAARGTPARLWVVELDGVMVLGKPNEGHCDGIEIKQVALYPYASPSERRVVADVQGATAFRDAVHGLVQLAGVTANDTLVGIGDGAAWVESLLDELCDTVITDCFHAAAYLDTVLLQLGFSEGHRAKVRRAWCRGEIDVASFLADTLPDPAVWMTWEEEAINALRYLEQRTLRMRYPHFKQLGYPIGSGMIEGLNKSVIGNRMKRSGMQWSRPGAGRMAALRAWTCSRHALVTFDAMRQHAYPPPSLDPVPLSA